MKKTLIFLLLITFSFSYASSKPKKPKKSEFTLSTKSDSVSYALGLVMGSGFVNPNMPDIKSYIIPVVLSRGIDDVINGEETLFDENFGMNYIQEFFTQEAEKLSKANREEEERFLKENAEKPGIVSTSSGLQYKVEREGEGIKPSNDDRIEIHYEGRLTNGEVFDSSYERGEPTVFGVSQVIRGFSEGLQLMPEGSKFTFYIPSELGYGERGAGTIKPNSTLIFDVELIRVIKDDKDTQNNEETEQDNVFEYRERKAGDYKEIVPDYIDEVAENFYVIKGYEYKGKKYLFSTDGLTVINNGNIIQKIEPSPDAGIWEMQVYNITLYEPIKNGSPSFFMIDESTGDYSYKGSLVYSISKTGKLEYAGKINLAVPIDSYDYSNGYNRSPNTSVIIRRLNGSIRFEIDSDQVVYNPEKNPILLSSSDLFYTYKNGKLEQEGSALSLSYFKSARLREGIEAAKERRAWYFVMGDVDGDGEKDALYQLEGDNNLYIALCKDYKIVREMPFGFDFKFELDSDPRGAIYNGNIIMYIDDPQFGYVPKNYRLVNGRLEENKAENE